MTNQCPEFMPFTSGHVKCGLQRSHKGDHIAEVDDLRVALAERDKVIAKCQKLQAKMKQDAWREDLVIDCDLDELADELVAILPIDAPINGMRYEIHIASQPALKVTQIQFEDLRNAIKEHERNGFRDGWSRAGSVRIVEIGG